MRRLLGFASGFVAGWLVRPRGPAVSRGRGPAASRHGWTAPPEFEALSLLAHELKTPVNILVGYIELLAHGIPVELPEEARDHVRNAHRASRELADLVNDLLSYARLRSGREWVHAEMVPVHDLVADASAAAAERAVEKGIDFATSVPADLYMVTDVGKTCQALRALVGNAVKFTDAGEVRVEVEADEDTIRFRVTDTGKGIDAAHFEAIFAPHWQVERSVRRPRGGAGIGLALCREVARLLGGSVTVRSEKAVGSTFVLRLPRRLDPDRFRGRASVYENR